MCRTPLPYSECDDSGEAGWYTGCCVDRHISIDDTRRSSAPIQIGLTGHLVQIEMGYEEGHYRNRQDREGGIVRPFTPGTMAIQPRRPLHVVTN